LGVWAVAVNVGVSVWVEVFVGVDVGGGTYKSVPKGGLCTSQLASISFSVEMPNSCAKLSMLSPAKNVITCQPAGPWHTGVDVGVSGVCCGTSVSSLTDGTSVIRGSSVGEGVVTDWRATSIPDSAIEIDRPPRMMAAEITAASAPNSS
jgi:hypothetical protein